MAVVWCYYSGKIEGNTYTYVETETLLKDGITPEKRYEDAKMLKNLHNTFVGEMEYINKGKNQEIIDERTLFRIHSTISDGLVSTEEQGNPTIHRWQQAYLSHGGKHCDDECRPHPHLFS